MNILLLPNSLKGSLNARQTARILENALGKKHTLKTFLLSDGGDGFIDFFASLYPQAQKVRVRAQNAFGKKTYTHYLWLATTKTAVLETARICGLGSAKKQELDPLGATSFGVGEVILHALKKGAKKIFIGLGGVACNDGGAGIAQALGIQLLDKKNQPLPKGAKPLLCLNRIDFSSLNKSLKSVRIYAVADVTNPLLGPQGSARVFGPQKGATPAQVRTLEKALSVYAKHIQKATQKDISRVPSTAAAGALCAGLYGLLQAEIILGSDFLKKHLPLQKWTRWADLLITTEGKLDCQTLYGKAPLAALQAAAEQHKKALFICGTCEEKALKNLPKGLDLSVLCLTDFATCAEESIKHAAHFLRLAARSI
ncbi:glycerate kinase [Candidatus Avelusimicrobium sp.]